MPRLPKLKTPEILRPFPKAAALKKHPTDKKN